MKATSRTIEIDSESVKNLIKHLNKISSDYNMYEKMLLNYVVDEQVRTKLIKYCEDRRLEIIRMRDSLLDVL